MLIEDKKQDWMTAFLICFLIFDKNFELIWIFKFRISLNKKIDINLLIYDRKTDLGLWKSQQTSLK